MADAAHSAPMSAATGISEPRVKNSDNVNRVTVGSACCYTNAIGGPRRLPQIAGI